MEKIIFLVALEKFTATLSLLFIFLQTNAQKMQMTRDYYGIYYKSIGDLYRQKQAELDFYGFKPRQAVASIGVRCGHWEAALLPPRTASIFTWKI